MSVRLIIEGRPHDDWETVEVQRSIESAVGYFSLGLSGEIRPVSPWASCRLELNGLLAIDGWIDQVETSETAGDSRIEITGRDRVADAVDCAAAADRGEWHNARLETIVAELVQPLALRVEVVSDTGAPLARYRVQEGESCWSAIERACRQRAILCYSDGARTLRLARAGSERAVTSLLRAGEGGNVLGIRASMQTDNRFSSYTFRGQRPSRDGEEPAEAAHVVARADDSEVPRYRPYRAMAEELADGVSLADRARWEMSFRRGRSRYVAVSVQGWRDGEKQLWRPNTRLRVQAPRHGLDDELLISGVRYILDTGGSRTELTLADPRAYDRLPEAGDEEDTIGW